MSTTWSSRRRWSSNAWRRGGSAACLGLRQVGLNVFQRQRQVIAAEALGATAELGALQLLDDRSEALDFAVPALDDSAHQLLQRRVGRQVVESNPV